MKPLRSFNEENHEWLRNPKNANAYVRVAFEEFEVDGDEAALMHAIKSVALAQGSIDKLAKRTKLSRERIARTFSGRGSGKIATLGAIVHELGFRLTLTPLKK